MKNQISKLITQLNFLDNGSLVSSPDNLNSTLEVRNPYFIRKKSPNKFDTKRQNRQKSVDNVFQIDFQSVKHKSPPINSNDSDSVQLNFAKTIRSRFNQNSLNTTNIKQPFSVKSQQNKTFGGAFEVQKERSKKNSGNFSKGNEQEQFYIYWKNKAHQYLQSNMKLMEQVRSLTKSNEKLTHYYELYQTALKRQEEKDREIQQLSKKIMKFKQIQTQNIFYSKKIQMIEKELKIKEIQIKSYQKKFIQLNAKINGDSERFKLMNKLVQQIEELKQDNFQLKCKLQDYENQTQRQQKDYNFRK